MAKLKKEFPDYATKIDKYVILAKRSLHCTTILTMLNFWLPQPLIAVFTRLVRLFYSDIFKKTSFEVSEQLGLTQNKRLMAILFGQFVNYGLPPSRSPFTVGSGTPLTHFVNGAIYPKEKPEMIIKSIVSTINYFGGQVLARCEVEKILVEKGAAVGVALKNGQVLMAERVVSGIGLE